jgi:hypothetical protein
MNWINEHQDGWVSIVIYQRWTGTYAVAKFDNRSQRFVGDIMACTGGIRHAHKYFEQMRNEGIIK